MKRKKILILMSATGGGHRSIAEALRQEFESAGHDALVFDALPSFIKDSYSIVSRYLLSFWGFLYWTSYRKEKISKIASRLGNEIAAKRVKRELILNEPDFILSTHPFISQIPSGMFSFQERQIPFGLVVCDPVTAHAVYFKGKPDIYFVPTEMVEKAALSGGVSREKIFLSGYPVRREFYQGVNIHKLRNLLRLNPSLFTILVGGSGEGVGNIFGFCKKIANFPLRKKFQAVVVCGKNIILYKKLIKHFSKDSRFKILPFQNNMADWMRAADVVVSKAGPSNLFEAVAAKKPFLAIGAMPGQEEGNLDLIRKEKIGAVEEDINSASRLISLWIEKPSSLISFEPFLLRLRQSHFGAANRIVKYIEKKILAK